MPDVDYEPSPSGALSHAAAQWSTALQELSSWQNPV